MSLLKKTLFSLGWLVVLLGGTASLSFCAVWGLDNVGLSPVWSVPSVGGLLAVACWSGFLWLKPAPQPTTPRPTWRDQVSSRTAQLRQKLAQVAPRVRPLWPKPLAFSSHPQAAASATGTPATVPTSPATVTPVHSIVIPVRLPPRPQVAPAASVTATAKEQVRYATNT